MDILVENSKHHTGQIKKYIIDNKILDVVCVECGVGDVYNGKPIILELDHINGNNRDNRLDNLRFLCPNCHSQTPTFRGRGKPKGEYLSDDIIIDAMYVNKNIYQTLLSLNVAPSGGNHIRAKKLLMKLIDKGENPFNFEPPTQNKCIDCGDEICKDSTRCRSCASKNMPRSSNIPPKDELINDILSLPFTRIGVKYSVSGNSVRKWCTKYDLPTTYNGVKEFRRTYI